MSNKRDQILAALGEFARQRPGLQYGNYCSGWNDRDGRRAYLSEMRSITRDLHDVRQLLAAVGRRSSIGETELRAAFRAYSGRLTLIDREDGAVGLDYCTGQYFPTEYRKAVCAVLASALWGYVRFGCMPAPQFRTGDGRTFATDQEARAHAERLHKEQNVVIGIEEKHDGLSPGDWIRRYFRREFGARLQRAYFN